MIARSFDRNFNRNFMLSFGAHVAILLLAYLGGEVVSRVFNNGDVEVIRTSVRVDVVGMPKFTVQELKRMQSQPIIQKVPEITKGTKEETKTETPDVIKKDDLVIQEPTKKKTSFLNIVNDYSSKKVAPVEKKKGTTETATADNKDNLDSLILEGNRLSKGSALVGDYTDEQTSEFSAYVQNIPGVVRPYWRLPSYLLEKNLRCRIKLFLSPEGKFLKLELQESSGVPEFDDRAQNAVRVAQYPVPSPEVGQRLTRSGVILGFPL